MSAPIDIPDPESFVRYGGDCTCGAVYTYGGIAEPGQFDPFCPDHGDPEYVKTLVATPACDCPLNPHHRWNCHLTPVWTELVRDMDCNPWTVVTNTVHRFGLYLTPESFERLSQSLAAITETERKAWKP